MLPGMGMNPRKMQAMMQKLGIKSEDIDAEEVVIRCSDKEIVISEPQVSKVEMAGRETFQVVGEVSERELGSGDEDDSEEVEISEDDVKMVVKEAKVSEKKARGALEGAGGDIAKAILELGK